MLINGNKTEFRNNKNIKSIDRRMDDMEVIYEMSMLQQNGSVWGIRKSDLWMNEKQEWIMFMFATNPKLALCRPLSLAPNNS